MVCVCVRAHTRIYTVATSDAHMHIHTCDFRMCLAS
jgi:hypothetical protein